MKYDIVIDVMGNTSPFSLMGESSGYLVTVNDRSYLLECGTPVFPPLGYSGIARIKGIFATHSHEDHKRWFTDIVLFNYYNPRVKGKARLISAEPVLEEYAKNSKAALERSLSDDSKRVIDIPYENMVEEIIIGPRAKYIIKLLRGGDGSFRYIVEDRQGQVIGPEKAKIFINPAANRPRLLFKDDESGEWVEPDSHYSFSSPIFYEEEQNVFHDEKAGLSVEAIKAPVWHGVPTVAYRFETEENSILYSADTVYRPSLWKELCDEYRQQKFEAIDRNRFEKSTVLYGDINDFIERTWSRKRYEAAMSAYKGSIIIHDVAGKNSVVHTDYPDIRNAPIEQLLFTHNPDNLTALRPILTSGKKLVFQKGAIYESVNGHLYPFDADVYVHHFSSNLIGYLSDSGAYQVVEEGGLLGIEKAEKPDRAIMRVDLYQDIDGEYFPLLTEADSSYRKREDGKVEKITYSEHSSRGIVVENLRGKIQKQS